jgi:metal transporter CNNM
MNGLKYRTDWAADYIGAAQTNVKNCELGTRRIHGISSPKPIGIITFEDIIDAILQKTSRDEKDFFDRDNSPPLTKARKSGEL